MTELDSESTDDDGDYVEYVTIVTLVHEKIHQVSETNINLFATEIYAKLAVNDEPVKFELDCRATINILPDKDAQCCDCKSTTKCAFVCGMVPKSQHGLLLETHGITKGTTSDLLLFTRI